ncbi:RNA-directed DNA polymerase, eukaryota [Tanacetum coccineum]
MASILVNGSPTDEFPIACGLKQGDPLAPLLFILVMETLHISVTRAVNDGVFKGFHLSDTMVLSHLFYADDALFIGEWSDENLANLIRILNCFHLASGLRINLIKSQVMGIGVPTDAVNFGAASIGCSVMNTPFKYLGVTVGDNMSRHSAWSDVMQKVRSRLSSWKAKTLSIGGRLTLLKAVLGAVPLYFMSIYKAPKGVLHELEKIRNKFFIGADSADRKISWVAWKHVLAGKKRGGLGVSSYFALNRALLLKWYWRFISKDGSLWYHSIQAIHGKSVDSHDLKYASCWNSILRELNNLSSKGFNFKSHCKIRVGNGIKTRFWLDKWVTDQPLCTRFPRIFALERNKAMTIDSKRSDLTASFRRQIRDGVESHQWAELLAIFNMVSFSSSEDRWYCDLNGDGMFHVKDIRLAIDEIFLPGLNENTRWVKFVPIKVNVMVWRARLDRLPSKLNLINRGISLDNDICPMCGILPENVNHTFFRCDLSKAIGRKICNWWNLNWSDMDSFAAWDSWFASIRVSGKAKRLLEGVFFTSWWSIWSFRNRCIFDPSPPKHSMLFDDIVSVSFLWCANRCSSFISH